MREFTRIQASFWPFLLSACLREAAAKNLLVRSLRGTNPPNSASGKSTSLCVLSEPPKLLKAEGLKTEKEVAGSGRVWNRVCVGMAGKERNCCC